MQKLQEYKRTLNDDVYNYLHQNRTNIIIYNLINDFIETAEAENWFGISHENPLNPSEISIIVHDLKQDVQYDMEHPSASLESNDILRMRYLDPISTLYAEIVSNEFYDEKLEDAVLDLQYRIAMLLDIANAEQNRLPDYSKWRYSRSCEGLMANCRFVCLACGFSNLFYYSSDCSACGSTNPVLHAILDPNETSITESIYVGCSIINLIQEANNKKVSNINSYVKDCLKKSIEHEDSQFKNGIFQFIWKWFDGWNDYRSVNANSDKDGYDHNIEGLIDFYIDQYNTYYTENRYINSVRVENLFGYLSYTLDFDVEKHIQSDISVIIGPNGIGKTTVLKLLESILVHPNIPAAITPITSISSNISSKNKYLTFNETIKEHEKFEYLCTVPFTKFVVELSNGDCIRITKSSADSFKSGKVVFETLTSCGSEEISVPIEFGFYRNEQDEFCINNEFEVRDACNRKIELLCPNFNATNRFNFIHTNRVNDSEWRDAFSYVCSKRIVDSNMPVYKYINNIDKLILPPFMVEFEHEYARNRKSESYQSMVQSFMTTFSQFYDKEEDISYKELVISNTGHLFVRINGKYDCEIEDLSTGEQNLLAILYNVIFKSGKNAILFIDEPEISLHIAWQQRLVEVITKLISQKEGMQVIIASHSPFIVSGNPELYVVAEMQSAEE